MLVRSAPHLFPSSSPGRPSLATAMPESPRPLFFTSSSGSEDISDDDNELEESHDGPRRQALSPPKAASRCQSTNSNSTWVQDVEVLSSTVLMTSIFKSPGDNHDEGSSSIDSSCSMKSPPVVQRDNCSETTSDASTLSSSTSPALQSQSNDEEDDNSTNSSGDESRVTLSSTTVNGNNNSHVPPPLWCVQTRTKVSVCYRQWRGMGEFSGHPLPGGYATLKSTLTSCGWLPKEMNLFSRLKRFWRVLDASLVGLDEPRIRCILAHCDQVQGSCTVLTLAERRLEQVEAVLDSCRGQSSLQSSFASDRSGMAESDSDARNTSNGQSKPRIAEFCGRNYNDNKAYTSASETDEDSTAGFSQTSSTIPQESSSISSDSYGSQALSADVDSDSSTLLESSYEPDVSSYSSDNSEPPSSPEIQFPPPLWCIRTSVKVSECYRQWCGIGEFLDQPVRGGYAALETSPTRCKWSTDTCHKVVRGMLELLDEARQVHDHNESMRDLMRRCDAVQGNLSIRTMGQRNIRLLQQLVDESIVAISPKKVAISTIENWMPLWCITGQVNVSVAYKQLFGIGTFCDYPQIGSGGVLKYLEENPDKIKNWTNRAKNHHYFVKYLLNCAQECLSKWHGDLDSFLLACDQLQRNRSIFSLTSHAKRVFKPLTEGGAIKSSVLPPESEGNCCLSQLDKKEEVDKPKSRDNSARKSMSSSQRDGCNLEDSVAGTSCLDQHQLPPCMDPSNCTKLSVIYGEWLVFTKQLGDSSHSRRSGWSVRARTRMSMVRNLVKRIQNIAASFTFSITFVLCHVDKEQGAASFSTIYHGPRWQRLEQNVRRSLKDYLPQLLTTSKQTVSSIYHEWYGLENFRDKPVAGGVEMWLKDRLSLAKYQWTRESAVRCFVERLTELSGQVGCDMKNLLSAADKVEHGKILSLDNQSNWVIFKTKVLQQIYIPHWTVSTKCSLSSVYKEWHGIDEFSIQIPGGVKRLFPAIPRHHTAKNCYRYTYVETIVSEIEAVIDTTTSAVVDVLGAFDTVQGQRDIFVSFKSLSELKTSVLRLLSGNESKIRGDRKESCKRPWSSSVTAVGMKKQRVSLGLARVKSRSVSNTSATKSRSITGAAGNQRNAPRWLRGSIMKVSEVYTEWVSCCLSDIELEEHAAQWFAEMTRAQRCRMNKIRVVVDSVAALLKKSLPFTTREVLQSFDENQCDSIFTTFLNINAIVHQVEGSLHRKSQELFLATPNTSRPYTLLSSASGLILRIAFDEWYGRHSFQSILPYGGLSSIVDCSTWSKTLSPDEISNLAMFRRVARGVVDLSTTYYVSQDLVVEAMSRYQDGMTLHETCKHLPSLLKNTKEVLCPSFDDQTKVTKTDCTSQGTHTLETAAFALCGMAAGQCRNRDGYSGAHLKILACAAIAVEENDGLDEIKLNQRGELACGQTGEARKFPNHNGGKQVQKISNNRSGYEWSPKLQCATIGVAYMEDGSNPMFVSDRLVPTTPVQKRMHHVNVSSGSEMATSLRGQQTSAARSEASSRLFVVSPTPVKRSEATVVNWQ